MTRLRLLLLAISLTLMLVVPAAASASTGYDISYPQCGGAFPASPAFGIVGVNGGKPYSANSCLGAGSSPSELAWGGQGAQLYANTADPGPALSSHWPNGQSSPKPCNTAANPGSDTLECHYDYGWNAMADSYQDAVNAYVSLGWAAAGATRTPVANNWWLDVETANSWTSSAAANVEALRGGADYLVSVGAASVGFYSSASNWSSITGSTAAFAGYESWVAGAGSLSNAQSACSGSGFTGGGVALAQYASGGFDADLSCTPMPSLAFGGTSQRLVAGASSGAFTVQLPSAAATDVAVQLSSTSGKGGFATDPAGPWSATLSLTIGAGQSSSPSFYYRDTLAGTPTLSATASGYNSASQSETIVAGPLQKLTVSPATIQLRVGASQSFSTVGADAYGNSVPASVSWSVTPALGSFSSLTANPTTFTAKSVGSGTVTASSGGVTGSASLSVVAKKKR